MNYRAKPYKVTAIQWTGENFDECKAFIEEHYGIDDIVDVSLNGRLVIEETSLGKSDYIVLFKYSYNVLSEEEFHSRYEAIKEGEE